jgi:hypothetical protein
VYEKNLTKDVFLFVSAFFSNQLAKFAPKLYVNLTHQTGRGQSEEDTLQVANYFIRCFHDYRDQINLSEEEFSEYLKGGVVLEYGPGDILGVALLMYAYGAKKVHCVDRFPLSKLSNKNIKVYSYILNSLDDTRRDRAANAFKERGRPESGLNPKIISYKITENGLSDIRGEYDLVISRAVLEHVNSLEETMLDISRSMKAGGISIHQVDLKSHDLDRYAVFDFLTWPKVLYKLMYSHKGFPNRWRIDKYKELARSSNLHLRKLTPTGRIGQDEINIIYSKLAKEFMHISPEDLSWLGFWMILEHT